MRTEVQNQISKTESKRQRNSFLATWGILIMLIYWFPKKE